VCAYAYSAYILDKFALDPLRQVQPSGGGISAASTRARILATAALGLVIGCMQSMMI
jgi:hypothetical protein